MAVLVGYSIPPNYMHWGPLAPLPPYLEVHGTCFRETVSQRVLALNLEN